MFTKKQLFTHVLIAVLAIAAGSGIMWAVQADEIDTTSCSSQELKTYYLDADGDGFGDPNESVQACTLPEGYSENDLDCDDSVAEVNPNAEEVCDPVDNNCDGQVNEGIATSTYYFDYDHDSYGDASTTMVWCTVPVSYATSSGDCDDSRVEVNPGMEEICDGLDNDCNGEIDDGLATSTFYIDADGDGFGSTASSTTGCAAPEGFVANSDDCSDASAGVYPGAAEICDGIDNDCDLEIDEGCNGSTIFYRDADGDGFGNPDVSVEAVTQPVGYVIDNTDCDDSQADVNPGETEICDGKDNDCDLEIDEGVKVAWYWDADNDLYGKAASTTLACTAPEGYVGNDDDCNDSDANINPGETEVCDDSIDNDCDGTVDEGCDLNTYYRDADGDGYGDSDDTKQATTTPEGYVSNSTDCDDTDASINPGANEICDGQDNDCDGEIDEGFDELNKYYRDADKDGYGDPDNYIEANSKPDCYVDNNDDCNDSNAGIHPGAAEKCDGRDNDCDGEVDEGCEGDGGGCDCDCTCECKCECQCLNGCNNNSNCDNCDNNSNNNNDNEEPIDCGSPGDYNNHGSWVSCMAHWTNWQKAQGNISGQIKGQVMSFVAKQKNSVEIKFNSKNNNKNNNKNKNKSKKGDDDD